MAEPVGDTAQHHALGQATVLDSGEVLVTGGLASIIWNGQPAIDVFTGTVVGGQAMRGMPGFRLSAPRLLHGAAALPNGGILVTGGAGVASDATRIMPLDTAEFFFLPGER